MKLEVRGHIICHFGPYPTPPTCLQPPPPLVLVVVHLGVVEYARTQVRLTVQGSFTVNSETTLHLNNCADTSRSWWSTCLTDRARNLVFHHLVTNILPNMTKNNQFGSVR